jgi:hypothetical protein
VARLKSPPKVPMRNAFGCLFLLVLLAAGGLFARDYVRGHPENVPWTELDLADPIGRFTGRKIAALRDEPRQCRTLLRTTDAHVAPAPPLRSSPDCGYADGMRFARAEGEAIFAPAPLVTSCPVAAALFLLRRDVIEPAARRHFGSKVAAIRHFGSYSCRRLYGRDEGEFSEHATANAVDIAGFTLADGTGISVLQDWDDEGPKGAFLRDVRDGACDLFATVLSPDYNEAHRDHLHLDQASRGAMGFRLCS